MDNGPLQRGKESFASNRALEQILQSHSNGIPSPHDLTPNRENLIVANENEERPQPNPYCHQLQGDLYKCRDCPNYFSRYLTSIRRHLAKQHDVQSDWEAHIENECDYSAPFNLRRDSEERVHCPPPSLRLTPEPIPMDTGNRHKFLNDGTPEQTDDNAKAENANRSSPLSGGPSEIQDNQQQALPLIQCPHCNFAVLATNLYALGQHLITQHPGDLISVNSHASTNLNSNHEERIQSRARSNSFGETTGPLETEPNSSKANHPESVAIIAKIRKINVNADIPGSVPKINFKCPLCDFTSEYKQSIKRHLDYRHHVRDQVQQGCTAQPSTTANVACKNTSATDMAHLRESPEEMAQNTQPPAPIITMPVQCDLCEAYFLTEQAHTKHKLTAHSAPPSKSPATSGNNTQGASSLGYRCPMCPYTTDDGAQFLVHFKGHDISSTPIPPTTLTTPTSLPLQNSTAATKHSKLFEALKKPSRPYFGTKNASATTSLGASNPNITFPTTKDSGSEEIELDGKELLTNVLLKCSLCQYSTTNHDKLAQHQVFKHRISMIDVEDRSLKPFTKFPNAHFENSQIQNPQHPSDSHDSFELTDAKEGRSEVDEKIPLLKLYLQQSSAPGTSTTSTAARASVMSSMTTTPPKLVIYSCRFCTFCDASHDSVRDHESSHHTPADLPELTRINPSVEKVKASSPWGRESNVSQETAGPEDENPSNTTYTCRYCGYSHHLQRIVLQHETNKHFKHLQDLVPGQKFVRCKDCNYIAPSKAMLVKHRAEHDEGPMYCKFCDFSTFYSPNLERHLKRHAVKSLYRCHKCTYSSPSNQGIILHRDRHHNGREFNITSAQATKLYFDRRKFKTDDPNTPGAESVCDELDIYNRHAEPQNIDKDCWSVEPKKMGDNPNSRASYSCPLGCGYEANTLSHLQTHITTLHDAQCCSIAECNLCHTTVDSLAQYMAHLSDLHPLTHKRRDPSPQFQEKEKSISAQNLEDLQSPVAAPKRVDNTRNNVNSKTGRPNVPHISRRYPHLGYPNRPVYKRVLPHEKDKHCTLCAYSTKWSCDLRLHYRNRHKVSKPYECQDCKRTFAYASDLRTHLKKTHGVDSRTALYEKVYSTFKGGVPSPNSLPSNSTPEPAKFNVSNGLCDENDSSRDCNSNGATSEEPSKNSVGPTSQFSLGSNHDLSSNLGFNTFEGILSSSPNLLQLFAQYTKHLASQQKSFEVARDTANNEPGDKLINTTLLNRLDQSESSVEKPVVPLAPIKSGVGRRTLRLKGSFTHKAKVHRDTTVTTPQFGSNLFENAGREDQTNGSMDACTSLHTKDASPLLGKLITANTSGQPDQDSDQDLESQNTVIKNISYPLTDNHVRGGKVIVKLPIVPSQPGKRLKLTPHIRDSTDNLGNASINQYFDLARMFKREHDGLCSEQTTALQNTNDNSGPFNLDFLQNYRVKGGNQTEGDEGDSFLNAYNLINEVAADDYQREPAAVPASVYQTIKPTSESFQNLSKTDQQQTSVSGPVKNSNISRTGSGKNVFGCPVCSYISNCAAKIKLHIAIHASEKLYNCSECGKRSYWSWDISKHIKAKHATAVGACTMKSPQAMKEIAELSKLPIRIMKPRGSGASDEFIKTGPNPPTKILRMEHQLYMHRQNLLQQKGAALFNNPDFSQQQVTEDGANFGALKPETAKNESRGSITTRENAPEAQNDRVRPGGLENGSNASCSYYSNPLLVYRCKFCEYKNARRLSTERHVYQVHGYKVTRRRQGQQQPPLQNNAGADPSSQDFVEDRDILTLDSSAIMPVVDNYYDRITPVNGSANATTSAQPASKLGSAVNPLLPTSTHSGPVTRVVTNSLTTTAAGNPRTNVFPCTICPFISNKATAFKRHQELHQDPCSLSNSPVVPYFKCPFCPYYVPLKRMLWQHLRMHVPNPQEILNRLRHYDPSAQCCDIDDAPLYEEQVKLTPYNLPWAWDQKPKEENVKEQSVNGGEEEKSGDLNDYRCLIPDDEGDNNSIKMTLKGPSLGDGKLSHSSGLGRDTLLTIQNYEETLHSPQNDHKLSYNGNEEPYIPPTPAEKSPNKRKTRVPFSLSSMLGTAVQKEKKNQELKLIYAEYLQKNDSYPTKTTPCYNGDEKLSSTVEPSNTVKQQDDTCHQDFGKDSTEHNISCPQASPIPNDATHKVEKHNLLDQIDLDQPSEDSLIPSQPPKPCRWGKDGNDISVAWGLKKGKYVRMFKCPYCPHLGTRRANVRIHISLHGMRQGMKGKLQHCPKCSFNCANPTRYMNHISMHADGIETIPNTQTSQRSSFESDPDSNRADDYHKDMPSKKMKVDLRCPHCPAKFCLERMLKRHMKFHSRRFKFHCKECTYTAPKAYQLVRHYKLHTSLSTPLSPEVTDGFTTTLIDPQIATDSLYNSSPAESIEDHHQSVNDKKSFSSDLLGTLVRGVDFMTKANKRLQSTSNQDVKQASEPSLNKPYERDVRYQNEFTVGDVERQVCKRKRPNSAPTINFERINNLLTLTSNGSRCKLHVCRRDISCQNCNYGHLDGYSLPHNRSTQQQNNMEGSSKNEYNNHRLKVPPNSQTSVIRENPFKSVSKSAKTTQPLPNHEFLHFCNNCGCKVNDNEYAKLQCKVKELTQSRVLLCDICTRYRISQSENKGENECLTNGNKMNNKINFDNNVFSTFLDHKPSKVDHSNDLPIKSS